MPNESDDRDVFREAAQRRIASSERPPRHPPLGDDTVASLRKWAKDYVRQDYSDASPEEQQRYAEQVVRAIRWLQIVWGAEKPCPYCTNRAWTVGVPVQLINGSVGVPAHIADDLPPVFPVTCTNCGQTAFISEAYTRQVDEAP